ncbi:MAG: sigma-54-dependent Fis family transcriptional regulator, partial [Gemmatimonadetes bacterium]|nr:sigma-54-dependent Fis family transcriptional regulator [Gemmatimonadota bacterium]NIQ59060.1 sigma-54-dependent Fis family transcriptional regulator [Gemmatimonadota bacterium]NIU72444.1 sigma-54-dependent Fis family transcriptional regulator [Gammaproteobacteria bacterium]NIX42904.1 sigma-54-dependent Fis family transcriptional regulator [Gemmatimonadota bacterium]NIY12314.1 sigma-54-dependent Fis family transcriptional regulator [Gemmatimonadota bacterium]
VLRLAEHFLGTFAADYDLPAPTLDRAARDSLLAHSWPGNVRELRNALERVVLLGDGAFRVDDLFLTDRAETPTGALPFPATL